MKSKKTLRVVVDADVARAAGLSDHPTSSSCRKLLMDILEVCHRVVFTAEIKAEWERNRSRFFTTWRRSMVARKKQFPLGDVTAETVIEQVETVPAAGTRRQMLKDVHLVAAAVAADRVIVSCDTRARKGFEALARSHRELKVTWINPSETNECALLRSDL